MTDSVQQERQDAVLLLMLNRPEKLNALNLALAAALVDALDAAEADEDVHVIVITGAGRAFCAGADLKEFTDRAGKDAVPAARRSAVFERLNGMVPAMSKPVITAVNGLALGGGCGLVISSDMAIASDGATFSYPELKYGMVPAGVLPPLARQVGRKAAFDLMGTARTFDAAEAFRLGIISRVVPGGEVLDEATDTARRMAGYDRAAMAGLKRLLNRVVDLPLADGLAAVRQDKENNTGE